MSITIREFPRIERAFNLTEPVRSLVGLPVTAPEAEETDAILHDLLADAWPSTVGYCGAPEIWRSRRDRQLRKLLQCVDLIVPRGPVLNMAARTVGRVLVRQPQSEWFGDTLLRVAGSRACRVFFLGGQDCDPFEWGRRAARRHPGLRVAGAHAPGPDFRDAAGCRHLVERLNRSRADLVVVLPEDHRGEHFSLCYRADIEARMLAVLWGGAPDTWFRRLSSARERRRRPAPRELSKVPMLRDLVR